MRRNDVVRFKESNNYFFGRVIRIIDDKALWICCGLHIHLTPIVDLHVEDYKGKLEWSSNGDGTVLYYKRDKEGDIIYEDLEDWIPEVQFRRPVRFIPMPSLRRLKQLASRYHGRNVWKTPLDYEYIDRI